jgi:hypothetical protein
VLEVDEQQQDDPLYAQVLQDIRQTIFLAAQLEDRAVGQHRVAGGSALALGYVRKQEMYSYTPIRNQIN